MDAFRSADQVLLSGVQGITDLITTPGLINLDFADVKSVMSGAGSALMGIGSARGDNRARQAAEIAIASPLLEASMDGAHGVLLSIYGGSDLGLFEINEAASLVAEAAHPDANIIFGAVIDDTLGDEVKVTVIAAGFDSGQLPYKKVDIRREPAAQARSVSPVTAAGATAPAAPATRPAAASRRTPAAHARPASADDDLDVPDSPLNLDADLDVPDFLESSPTPPCSRRARRAELAASLGRGARTHRRRVRGGRPRPARRARWSRSPRPIRLPMSTRWSQLGVRDIGESRDQEARAKVEPRARPRSSKPEPVRWHLVGRLQTNKARQRRDVCARGALGRPGRAGRRAR